MATLSSKQFESSVMVAKGNVSHDFLSGEKPESDIVSSRNGCISPIAVVDDFIRAEDYMTSILFNMATFYPKQFESSAMVANGNVSHDFLSEEKTESDIVPNRNECNSAIAVVDRSRDANFIRAEDYMTSILFNYAETMRERSINHIGYPVNLCIDHYASLAPLLSFNINNCGDPFIDINSGLRSKQFEVGVLDWFAQLWEIEKDEYWGYVTNGGTEGNLHGLWIGREMLPDGILYTSKESHYSIFKAARMYRMKCVIIDTLITGEIDYADFKRKLLLNKDKPAIINVNIGTTFKGAIDDLDLVIQTLEECGFTQNRFYIHCDAALFGLMLPFIKHGPKISFKKPIGSMSVSGHKFLGCPMPCGIQMTRKKYIDLISQNVEYISSIDATISGSRNGHTPIFIWYSLSKKGQVGLEEDVKICLQNARYFKNCLTKAGIRCMLNEWSITVVFERPRDKKLVQHWQLSCEENLAHVVVLPNVTKEKLNHFFQDLISEHLM